MNQIEVKVDTSMKSNLDFEVHVKHWILLSQGKKQPRAYIVDKISGNFYVNSESSSRNSKDLTIEPSLTILGRLSNAAGTRWNTRWTYWNWGTRDQQITFGELPAVIKEAIYLNVVTRLKAQVIELTTAYKQLDGQDGFIPPKPTTDLQGDDDSDGVFMNTAYVPKGTNPISRWENHDVSRFSIARKELGLPKPKRTRKPKAVI